MPDLPLDVLRQVALAGRILDQDYLAGADHPALAVAGGDFDPGIEIDDVLPARCRVPVDVVLRLGLAKDDAGGRQALGQLAAAPLLYPFHFDIAEMRLAARIGIEIVDAHLRPSSEKSSIGPLLYLREAFVHYADYLDGAHSPQAQALEGTPFCGEIPSGHAADDRDERVDRRRRHPRRSPERAHRDKTGRDVFGDEFVVERARRAGRLIGSVAVVGEPLAGFDEARLAHAVSTIEPVLQARDRRA